MKRLIQPVLSGAKLLQDIRSAEPEPGFRAWWLGQSGFLVQWEHRHLLIDPYLSDSLTRKYANTDKPHVRMTDLAIEPERLHFVDVVSSSHNHTDHLDAETLQPILKAGAQLVVAEANREFAAGRMNVDPDGLWGIDDGETEEVCGFVFTGVPSAHEELSNQYMGYVIEFGSWTIYHPGDTVLYPGMAERLREWKIDVAMLPINGRAPERRVAGNLNGREAAGLAHAIGARMVIPCHYEMFEFNTASPEEFVDECRRLGQPYRVLRCGERLNSSEL